MIYAKGKTKSLIAEKNLPKSSKAAKDAHV